MKTRDKAEIASIAMDRENNHTGSKKTPSNKVKHILLKIHASIYLFESITWIPIQILYVDRHFEN